MSLSLVACGGGGGGPVTETPVITSANYQSVAQEALSSSFYLVNSAGFASPSPTASALNLSRPATLLQLAAPRYADSARRQLAQTSSVACAGGGTMSMTFNDANNNNALDTGDSFALTMFNCRDGTDVFNGSMSLNVNSLTGDQSTPIYSMVATLTLANLSTASATSTTTGNGTISVSIASRALNDQSVAITAPSFSNTVSTGGVSHSVTLSNFSATTTITSTGSSTAVNGAFASSGLGDRSITLNTVTPFVQSAAQSYPGSGQLVVTDGANHKVRVTAVSSSSVQIEADADGNGSYELSISKLWTELI
jgi:hypothetical protein